MMMMMITMMMMMVVVVVVIVAMVIPRLTTFSDAKVKVKSMSGVWSNPTVKTLKHAKPLHRCMKICMSVSMSIFTSIRMKV